LWYIYIKGGALSLSEINLTKGEIIVGYNPLLAYKKQLIEKAVEEAPVTPVNEVPVNVAPVAPVMEVAANWFESKDKQYFDFLFASINEVKAATAVIERAARYSEDEVFAARAKRFDQINLMEVDIADIKSHIETSDVIAASGKKAKVRKVIKDLENAINFCKRAILQVNEAVERGVVNARAEAERAESLAKAEVYVRRAQTIVREDAYGVGAKTYTC
jgi:hypothetical protein